MLAALLATCWVLLEIGTRLAARFVSRRLTGGPLLLTGTVLGLSVLLVLLLGLGSVGSIGRLTLPAVLLACLAAAIVLEPRWHLRAVLRRSCVILVPRRRRRSSCGLLAWICLCAVIAVTYRAFVSPDLAFDSLYYHLPFTAEVERTGGIPLGDDAQAHQPKNHGLLSAGMQLLAGNERVALGGGALWLAVAVLALYVAARSLGCGRAAALGGTLVPFFVPEFLAQATGAMADLPFAAAWLAFASSCLVGVRTRDPRLAIPAGLAFGLALGCKSLAIPFLPLALGFAAASWVRVPPGHRRAASAWFCAGTLVTGAFFYVRNYVLTGNPLYPIEVRALGNVLFPGDYGDEVMKDWIFAQRGRTDQPFWLSFVVLFLPLTGAVRPLVVSGLNDLTLIGLAHFVVPVLMLLSGALARGKQLMTWWCAAVPPLVLMICWFVLPYTYGRFALLAVPFLGLLASCLASRRFGGYWLATLGVVFIALVDASGVLRELGIAAICAGPLFAAGWKVKRALFVPAIVLLGLFGIAASTLIESMSPIAPPSSLAAGPMTALQKALPFVRGNVAVAGTELRYGFQIGRHARAERVPLDGRSELPYHLRALRWRADGLPRPRTPEARLQDRFADPAAWLATLQRDFHTLVVARLHDQALLAHRHDQHGFPEELSWARAARPALEEVYADSECAVFRVHAERQPEGKLPPARERTEPEALTLLSDPEALARWYPLATQEMAKPIYGRAIARILAQTRPR